MSLSTLSLIKYSGLRALLLALLATLVVWPTPFCAAEETIAGKVVAIVDGDTVDLLDAGNGVHRIRIAGIDTPERGQPYGHVATDYLAALSFQKLAIASCAKRDRFGRLVCVVRVNGEDVGLAQIKAGLAWHYKKYANEQSPRDQDDYSEAERAASFARKGLWQESDPVPPWDWRKSRTGR